MLNEFEGSYFDILHLSNPEKREILENFQIMVEHYVILFLEIVIQKLLVITIANFIVRKFSTKILEFSLYYGLINKIALTI
jgi:hypothetical protein